MSFYSHIYPITCLWKKVWSFKCTTPQAEGWVFDPSHNKPESLKIVMLAQLPNALQQVWGSRVPRDYYINWCPVSQFHIAQWPLVLSIGQNLQPFTGNGDTSWVKNSQVRRKNPKQINCTNLNSLYPRMLCVRFSWNWPFGSGEIDNKRPTGLNVHLSIRDFTLTSRQKGSIFYLNKPLPAGHKFKNFGRPLLTIHYDILSLTYLCPGVEKILRKKCILTIWHLWPHSSKRISVLEITKFTNLVDPSLFIITIHTFAHASWVRWRFTLAFWVRLQSSVFGHSLCTLP